MKRVHGSYDKLEKYEKIRRGGRRKKSDQRKAEASDFVVPEEQWTEPLAAGSFAARVVEVHKRYCFVSREDQVGQVDTSDVWLCTVARKHLLADRNARNFVSVGDRVLVEPADQFAGVREDLPCAVVQALAPRRSQVARLDPMHNERRHILASNVDQLVIVASYLKPKVKWGLIDRYLVLAESQRLPALIVLNKKDLLAEANNRVRAEAEHYRDVYRQLGYQVIETIANESGETLGQDELAKALEAKISILSGHSGVGKSSLANLFDPEIVQVVEPDEDIFYKGRHTTTFASFVKLGIGGYLIDTPGIRSFLIEERGPIELSDCFVEMRAHLGQCKYRECRHIDEPDCLIKAAVKEGRIDEGRYRSYVAILTGATGREGRIRELDVDEE